MGDMSSLRETIDESCFYARDRGEEFNKSIQSHDTFQLTVNDSWIDYVYIFNKNHEWLVDGVKLEVVLHIEDSIANDVY